MAVLTCIQEIPDFSLRWVTWLPWQRFSWFSSVYPGKCQDFAWLATSV